MVLIVIVLGGPASPNLSRKVAELLNANYSMIDWKIFPDGESYIKCPIDVKDEEVIVIQTTFPYQDKRLIELFLILDLIRDLNAKEVTVVIPYLAYMRQDKRFLNGEALSIKTIAKIIESLGVDRVVSIDIHSPLILDYFNIEFQNLSAMPSIGDYIKRLNLREPFILAPDKKASKLAKNVAEIVNAPYGYLEKKRDLITGKVETKFKRLNVEGKNVIIVDDIISTGGTIVNAARIVKSLNPIDIRAACTHALLVGNAFNRLKEANVIEVIGTDTIESEFSKVTVAQVIADALR